MYTFHKNLNLRCIKQIPSRKQSFINIRRIFEASLLIYKDSIHELLRDDDPQNYHANTYEHYHDEHAISTRDFAIKYYHHMKISDSLEKLKKSLDNIKVVYFNSSIDDIRFEKNTTNAHIHQFNNQSIQLPQTTKALSELNIRKISNNAYVIESDTLFSINEFNQFAILYKTDKGCQLVDEHHQVVYDFTYSDIKHLRHYLEEKLLDFIGTKDNDSFIISSDCLNLASHFSDIADDSVIFKTSLLHEESYSEVKDKLDKMFERTSSNETFNMYQIILE